MGCGSSKDPKAEGGGKKPGAPPPPPPPWEKFPEFPTPRRLAEAQRLYAERGYSHAAAGDQSIPEPFPPPLTKAQVMESCRCDVIDKHARDVPKSKALGNLRDLVDYLVKDATNVVEKLRAIFAYIACANLKDFMDDKLLDRDSAPYKLMLARAKRYEYNMLFEEMCQCADIPCRVVKGYVRGISYRHGEDPFYGNRWCLVYHDNQWGFVDMHFGSQYVSKVDKEWEKDQADISVSENTVQKTHFSMNDHYFLPDPEKFIFNHYHEEPKYQLLARDVTFQEHKEMANVKTSYFDFDFKDLSQPKCFYVDETGKIEFEFDHPDDRSLSVHFVLYKQRGLKTTENVDGLDIKNYVLNERIDMNKTHILLNFKFIGRYKLELQAIDKKNPGRSFRFIDYVIKCNKPSFNLKPYPQLRGDQQELGPGPQVKTLGIEPEIKRGLMKAKNGKVQIKFKKNQNPEDIRFHMELMGGQKDQQQKAMCKNSVLYESDDTQATGYFRFPTHGQYLININMDGKEEESRDTCTYLVESDMKCVEGTFPPDRVRQYGGSRGQTVLRALSHQNALLQHTEGSDLHINMELMKVDCQIAHEFQCWSGSGWNEQNDYVWSEQQGSRLGYHLRFPTAGSYRLSMWNNNNKDHNKKDLLWKYLVEVTVPSEAAPPLFPSREQWQDNSEAILMAPKVRELPENTDVQFKLKLKDVERLVVKKQTGTIAGTAMKNAEGELVGTVHTGSGREKLFVYAANATNDETKILTYNVVTTAQAAEAESVRRRRMEDANKQLARQKEAQEKEVAARDARRREEEDRERREREHWERNKDQLLAEEERLDEEAIKEAEVSREKHTKEEELKIKTPSNPDDIVKKQKEDIKQEQDSETARCARLYRAQQAEITRSALRTATKKKDASELETCIKRFTDLRLKEKNGDLTNAKKTLRTLNFKAKLKKAVDSQDVDTIWDAIEEAYDEGHYKYLQNEINEAVQIANFLDRMNHLKLRILDMDNKTLAELRNYQCVTDEVRRVMIASFLLLGENEEKTADWNECRKMLKTTGKNSLKKRIIDLDNASVDVQVAARAKELLDGIHVTRIQLSSAGAATFYVWAKGVLDSIEQSRSLTDVEPASIALQKKLFGQTETSKTPRQYAEDAWTKEGPEQQ